MGLTLLWKPRGPGSQTYLGDFKRRLRLPGHSRTGIGHTGTLDPFAEGVLCVGTGEGTKLLAPLMGLPKTYRTTMLLGMTSDSLDDTGTLTKFDFKPISERLSGLVESDLEGFLARKQGSFEQLPPQHSAVHIDGKRAYEWARMGVEKELKPRLCEIQSARHLGFREDVFQNQPVFAWDFEVRVSSGTYIRCLARDWGSELCGQPGMLSRLVRHEVGPFAREAGEDPVWLGLSHLESLFEICPLSEREAEGIQRFGRWDSRPGFKRPGLLIAPSGQAVAWMEAETGRLGRVFTADPLQFDH